MFDWMLMPLSVDDSSEEKRREPRARALIGRVFEYHLIGEQIKIFVINYYLFTISFIYLFIIHLKNI